MQQDQMPLLQLILDFIDNGLRGDALSPILRIDAFSDRHIAEILRS
jgi:hypothetical protein